MKCTGCGKLSTDTIGLNKKGEPYLACCPDSNYKPMAHFSSVDEAVKLLKLDKRHKWQEWNGELSYPFWYTAPCSGCSCDCSDGYGCNHGNSGCHECGYTGKRRNVVPVPAFMPDGSTVKVVLQN
jgi:hypothetical protein